MREIVDQVIDAYGGVSKVQERFDYSEPMAVYNWRSRGIPRSLIADIHIDTGISVDRLRMGTPTKKTRDNDPPATIPAA